MRVYEHACKHVGGIQSSCQSMMLGTPVFKSVNATTTATSAVSVKMESAFANLASVGEPHPQAKLEAAGGAFMQQNTHY